jgi:outer membrane immunogenic protein
MMKKSFLASCGLLALGIVPAAAADMATKAALAAPLARPIYDWTGVYLGLNGGGAWSQNCMTMKGYNVPVISINGSPFLGVSNVNNASEGCNNATGAVVGGHIGYRYQTAPGLVFGLEAQGDWADLKGSNASPVLGNVNTFLGGLRIPGAASLTNTSKVDAIGMFKGQVGYALGPVLLYATGGAAITHTDYSGLANANVGTLLTASLSDAGSAIRFGGVAGGGLDWMFAPNWTFGVEYNHLFMGSQQVGMAYTGNTLGGTALPKSITAGNIVGIPSRTESVSGDLDMVTARIGYKF